jgi:hypothetical protein
MNDQEIVARARLDDLFDRANQADHPARADRRPELAASISTTVDSTVRPPVIVVTLRLAGMVERVDRLPARDASVATLVSLIGLVRACGQPTRIRVGIEDPLVERVLRGGAPPPWLQRAALMLAEALVTTHVTIEVCHLDLGDHMAATPRGLG